MVGPLQRARGGYTHLFVAIDKFTKWIKAKPVTTITTTKAKEFFQDIMVRFGVPNRIITEMALSSLGWNSKIGVKSLT